MTLLAVFAFFTLLLLIDGFVTHRRRKPGPGDTSPRGAGLREHQGGSSG
jgi:hypothetical protein